MTTAAWQQPETAAILAFVRGIGIPVVIGEVGSNCFMPGMTVRDGALVCDPDRLGWPGDLLHEAGHIAVSDPGRRLGLDDVSDDPAEEMAAIAWSYAAARAIGIAPALVFHGGGYHGGGAWVLDALEGGALIGQPLLAWFGMTSLAPGYDSPVYPAMSRWLR